MFSYDQRGKRAGLSEPLPQKLQKSAYPNKKVRTCTAKKNRYNDNYREQNSTLNTEMEVRIMALSNLIGWNRKQQEALAAACGTSCGADDKPDEAPAACGAADKPEEELSACGSACGAGDK